MEVNTVLAVLGGLGVGSLLNSLVAHFTNQRSKQKERRYEEKKAAYIGLLTSLHDAAVYPLRIPEDLITNSVSHLITDSGVFDHFNASRSGLSFKGV
ncbi:hypothetical protein ELY20_11005 [Legionella qingyii]|uniref:Uncharacterized protein n=1 Tax=Legionella qingyii TaxID=2184757 RepID=A0ABY0CH11_9GAMM|nr:hypothetical protein [Legionella qingyii]RUR21750.1 hypothetical protein ELY20_11005 [Legionella qingyii]